MALVTAPLMSLSASGKLKDTMTFVCGTLVRMADEKEKKADSPAQTENQTKWKDGASVWTANPANKTEWDNFGDYVEKSGYCDVSLNYYFSGYQLFMAYYMKLGKDGWTNYPNPPLTPEELSKK